MSGIDPRAVVEPGARLAAGVTVGPFAVVEAGAVIGADSRIHAHAVVRSGTVLGAGNVIHPFAVIGGDPQDRGYAGEETSLVIGDGNCFREHVTVHRGSRRGEGVTRIGSHNLFMAAVHVAHDAVLGDRIELANGTLLGGHAVLDDGVASGGAAAVAPFARIRRRAFIAAGSMVERDVPPFVIVAGDRARVRALNRVGLEREGVPEPSRAALHRAFRELFASRSPRAVTARRLLDDADPFVRELAGALLSES